MLGTIIRFLVSSYIPAILTPRLLPLLHSVLPLPVSHSVLAFLPFHLPALLSSPPPRPGTPAYATHYRVLYTILSLLSALPAILPSGGREASYYAILGVKPGVDEGELRAAFRRWARVWHPDRVAARGGAKGAAEAADEVFMKGRQGYEALKDPLRRFVYDRFGPSGLEWGDCTTPREFVRRGVVTAAAYQAMSFAGLVLFTFVGKRRSPILFWRFLLFSTCLALELGLILAPSQTTIAPSAQSGLPSTSVESPPPSPTPIAHLLSAPTLLQAILPTLAPFEIVGALRRAFIALNVILTRVFPAQVAEGNDVGEDARMYLERIEKLGKAVESEVLQMLDITMKSIRPSLGSMSMSSSSAQDNDAEKVKQRAADNSCAMDRLTREMENMIIERKLLQEASGPSPLRTPWQVAVRRAMAASMVDETRMDQAQGNLSTVGVSSQTRTDNGVVDGKVKWPAVAGGGTSAQASDSAELKLPSPPPDLNFPPGMIRRGSGAVRNRSVTF